MRHILIGVLLCAGCALGQATLDWPFLGGDAGRSGWEKSDFRITKDNVKDFVQVLKRKLPVSQAGPKSVTPPVVIGRLISYRGFKELGFVQTNADELWAIDVDTDRVFWQKKLSGGKRGSGSCAAMAVAVPALTPPTNFAARPRPGTAPAARPPVAPAPANRAGLLGSTGFGAARPAFAVSTDGKLHVLNTSTGDDLVPAIPFIPADAKATALSIADGVLLTATSSACGGAPDAVWAMDLNGPDHEAHSFKTDGEAIAGTAGMAFGSNGTVYVQTAKRLLALSHKGLELKGSYALAGAAATPLVYSREGHDFVITASADGRLMLFDSANLSAPVAESEPLGGSVWGGLSSWIDADGARWVVAPVWGKAAGSVNAWKVDETAGKSAFSKGWVSDPMASPEPAVITAGTVFVLAAGGPSHATLYALDGLTGKEVYSTGNQVTAPGTLNGVTLVNGRVYFATQDGTLWAFGIYLER